MCQQGNLQRARHNGNQRPVYGNANAHAINPQPFFANVNFKETWIKSGADEELPTFADAIGKELADHKLTRSQFRNIYGEIKRIQMRGFEAEKASFYLLRPKVAYALGRIDEKRERDKYQGMLLFKRVFDKACEYVNNEQSYKNFCNLFEAILAYHRANGGKD